MNTSPDYPQLLQAMQERVTTITDHGAQILLKRIPDSDGSGELDARVKTILVEMLKQRAQRPPVDLSQLDPATFPVEMLRAGAGFPNQDMSRGQVKSESREISGSLGSIPVSIHTPQGNGPFPAVVYFHGGGFIGGSMAGLENICKTLAFHANAVVVNVEYRLAPEHPFPAAPTDAYDAVKWVHANAEALKVNPDQIAVSGDSAGGNLTIVCALMDRDQGNHFIKLQAPIYPVVNLPNQPTADFAWTMDAYEMRKDQELSSAAVNSLRGMASTFNSLYLQNDDLLTTPYASPYFEENLSGLPEALIFTAEYDFLRPQGEAYGRRLRAAGIPTTIIRYAGIDHGFIDKCGFFPQSEDCLIEIAKKIKSMFV